MLDGPRGAVWPVALWIAELAKGDGAAVTCTPSHALLAELVGISPRTVRRYVARLVHLGWLERIGPRAHVGRAVTYRLRAPVPAELQAACAMHKGMWRDMRECRAHMLSCTREKSRAHVRPNAGHTESQRRAYVRPAS
jgi:DNA-binding transcriptional regulator PaaX